MREKHARTTSCGQSAVSSMHVLCIYVRVATPNIVCCDLFLQRRRRRRRRQERIGENAFSQGQATNTLRTNSTYCLGCETNLPNNARTHPLRSPTTNFRRSAITSAIKQRRISGTLPLPSERYLGAETHYTHQCAYQDWEADKLEDSTWGEEWVF